MTQETTLQKEFPCRQCGAKMSFDPGAGSVKCPYCGHENALAEPTAVIEELDYLQYISQQADQADQAGMVESLTVKCSACGAETTLAKGVTADACPFCGSPIVAQAVASTRIKPLSLLPFAVTQQQALDDFRKWISGLWFAPGKLAAAAKGDTSRLAGAYVPYWTYDCDTLTRYTGQRGDDYTETETYTTTENGKTVTRTREVRKTRWHSVSGQVSNQFDDLLVLASRSLPREKTEKLEPWDLSNLKPYDEDYLAGFRVECYQVGLEEGFGVACDMMTPEITRTIEGDIGGDHQRIDSRQTRYDDVTFKHILLPIWISAYRFRDQTFRFLVNGRTGEVQGERPWSFWKIFLFVLAIVAAVVLLAIIFSHRK